MLVTCRQMQEIEERAFLTGTVTAESLMEQAGCGIAAVVRQFFPSPGTLLLYLGSGHNAGDALVAARELAVHGWNVDARLSAPVEKMKPLTRRHFDAMAPMMQETVLESISGPLVQLDGLLGIGGSGPLRPPIRMLAAEMNAQRLRHGASTVAMDIPSGLNADTGELSPDAVVADITVTVAFAKQGLLADAATSHVGRLAWVPLAELTPPASIDRAALLTPALLRTWMPRRGFEFHKGQAGRVGILAGSRGFFGAAELACRGALRAGAGLVTLFVKEDAYELLAARMPPEVMVRQVSDYREVLDLRWDALAIGPGLGFEHETEVLEVIEKAPVPAVVDADALTQLAKIQSAPLQRALGTRLLTPHPGEMARLLPDTKTLSRREQAEMALHRFPGHTVLLKGARTIIASESEGLHYNTTGHPGMATGGMGDVLTGVCAALIGQGLSVPHAAGIGSWMCGRAAERVALTQAAESTLPSDVIAHLGQAWAELMRSGVA